MALVMHFQELIESLKREIEFYVSDELEIHLFVNDLVPDEDTELAEFTEATATWYAAIALDGWVPGDVTWVAPRATVSHPEVTWTPDGSTAETAYGYFVTTALGALAWSERFTDGPYVIGPAAWQGLGITPVRTRRSEFPGDA